MCAFTAKVSPRPPPKPPQNTPWPKSSPEEALGGPRGAWGGSGGALGELWEALGEPVGGSGGALGELWEAPYIEKLPINRPSGRYVICCISTGPSYELISGSEIKKRMCVNTPYLYIIL